MYEINCIKQSIYIKALIKYKAQIKVRGEKSIKFAESSMVKGELGFPRCKNLWLAGKLSDCKSVVVSFCRSLIKHCM